MFAGWPTYYLVADFVAVGLNNNNWKLTANVFVVRHLDVGKNERVIGSVNFGVFVKHFPSCSISCGVVSFCFCVRHFTFQVRQQNLVSVLLTLGKMLVSKFWFDFLSLF